MKFKMCALDMKAWVFSLLVLITAAAKQTKSKQWPQPSRRKRVANLECLQLPALKKWSTIFYRKLSPRSIWFTLWVMFAPPSFGPNSCFNFDPPQDRLGMVLQRSPSWERANGWDRRHSEKQLFSAKSFLAKLWLAVQKNSADMLTRSAKSIHSTFRQLKFQTSLSMYSIHLQYLIR